MTDEQKRAADVHTPGPWEWVGRDLEQIGGEYKTVIETEVSCGTFCYGGCVAMTMSDADQRLIAAAPKLLEALIAYTKAYDESPHLGPRGSAVDQAFAKARDAITDATGA